MAIDEINEAGGLLGKQVEIIRYDSKEFAPEVVMQGPITCAARRSGVRACRLGRLGPGCPCLR
jgi:hypothetical protein